MMNIREEHNMKQIHVTAEPIAADLYVVACSEDDFFTMAADAQVGDVMYDHMLAHGATNLVAH